MSYALVNLRSDALDIDKKPQRAMDAKRIDAAAETVVRVVKKFYGLVTIGWTGDFAATTATIKGFYQGESEGCVIRDDADVAVVIDFSLDGGSVDLDQLATYDEFELTFNAAVTTGAGNQIYVGLGA